MVLPLKPSEMFLGARTAQFVRSGCSCELHLHLALWTPMPRTSSNQGPSAVQCDHKDALSRSQCLSLLQTLSTADSIDAFHQSQRLATFVRLCGNEPCPHFKVEFLVDLCPGSCRATARALQLLHSSTVCFQQQPLHLLLAVCDLLWSFYMCMTTLRIYVSVLLRSSVHSLPEDLSRPLVAVSEAGQCVGCVSTDAATGDVTEVVAR